MRAACLVCALALAGLPGATRAAVVRTGQPVMGTVLEVTVVADNLSGARKLADAAVAEARRWEDVLTTWRPDGELARLNAHAGKGPLTVSETLAASLGRMRELAGATGGAFDPAVGRLVELWRQPAQPSAADLARAGVYRIAAALRVQGRRATLASGARLDAGGLGKGLALDAMAALLRSRGAEAAFLDFGGSSQLAFGAPPDDPQGWRLVVTALAPGTVHGAVLLRDAALSTSRATGAGTAAGPIVDPRTGSPVEGQRLATVLAADATTAEGWSTALIVLGREGVARLQDEGHEGLFEDTGGVARTAGFSLVRISAIP